MFVDTQTFGDPARSLVNRVSRRGLGLAATGAALGAVAARLPLTTDAKKKKKKKFQTVRQPLTQTFTNPVPINTPQTGAGLPYPSTLAVSGYTNGVVTDVNLILTGFTNPSPDNIDILLTSPDGRQAFVMGDVGNGNLVTNINLILDDEAAAPLPNGQLTSGTFRPTNLVDNDADAFPPPAPVPNGSVALSAFDGADPNGTWQVFVVDDDVDPAGSIGSWGLEITAEVDVQVKKKKKKKKK